MTEWQMAHVCASLENVASVEAIFSLFDWIRTLVCVIFPESVLVFIYLQDTVCTVRL